ncbi:hypothetical protein V8C42DRAFT_313354 [Trichoderma barbatum]
MSTRHFPLILLFLPLGCGEQPKGVITKSLVRTAVPVGTQSQLVAEEAERQRGERRPWQTKASLLRKICSCRRVLGR